MKNEKKFNSSGQVVPLNNSSLNSGLNADMIDGYHFSDLESRYVNVSGDTMSGNLSITAGSESSLTLGTANSGEIGALYIYASGTKYHKIVSSATGQYPTITLPNASGTFALTSDLSAYSLTTHTHDDRYVLKSGDTMNGNLSITAGSESALVLGTATSGEIGALYIYASGSKYHKIISAATGQYPTITLPNASGTISLEGHTHSNYLPLSAGSSYPLTGDLYLSSGKGIRNTTNDTSMLVELRGNNSGQYFRVMNGEDGIGITDSNWTHTFQIKDNATYAELYHNTGLPLYINTGNVGIGTNSPAYKLDVSGSLNATTIYQNGVALGARAFDSTSYLPLSGGTMGGIITMPVSWNRGAGTYALNMNNSDIIGLQGLYTADYAGGWTEGINFRRSSSDELYDTIYASDGTLYFALSNGSTVNTVIHSGNYTTYCATANHTHDDRYYTESESDSRYVNVTGDTMTGTLTISTGSESPLNVGSGVSGDYGAIYLYASGSKYHKIVSAATGAYQSITIPNASGTMALTSDIPTKSSWNYDDRYSLLGHIHDDRYYTESESDNRYVYKSGDTMSGNLGISTSGESALSLGNSNSGIYGALYLYASGSRYTRLVTAATGASHTITFPNADGTVSLEGHTHSYLPLSGGTMSGNISINTDKGISIGADGSRVYYGWFYRLFGVQTIACGNNSNTYLILPSKTGTIATTDDITNSLVNYFPKSSSVSDYNTWNDSDQGFSIWTPDSTGRPTSYGTSLNFRDPSTTWYYRLMFGTDNRIYYRNGINTTTLSNIGTLAYTSDLNSYSLTTHNHDGRYILKSGDSVTGVIYPSSNSTINLGTDSLKFHYLYVHRILNVQSICNATSYDVNKLDLPSKSGTIAVTSDFASASVNYANSAGSVAWDNVTSKPSTATRWPSWDEVTSKPSTATRWPSWDEVTSKPSTATRWPSWDEVTSKPSTFTPSSHTHDYVPRYSSVSNYNTWNDSDWGFSEWAGPPSSTGAPTYYGTSLNFRDSTTWYFRLMFGTDNRIYYRNGINTTTLSAIGTIAYTSDFASASVNYANSAGSVAWDNITGKPSNLGGDDYIWKSQSGTSYKLVIGSTGSDSSTIYILT